MLGPLERPMVAVLKCSGRSTWIGRWSLEPLERPTLEHLERPMVAGVAGAADAGALEAADGRWGRWNGRRWSTMLQRWSVHVALALRG